jgi:hypothetical protein
MLKSRVFWIGFLWGAIAMFIGIMILGIAVKNSKTVSKSHASAMSSTSAPSRVTGYNHYLHLNRNQWVLVPNSDRTMHLGSQIRLGPSSHLIEVFNREGWLNDLAKRTLSNGTKVWMSSYVTESLIACSKGSSISPALPYKAFVLYQSATGQRYIQKYRITRRADLSAWSVARVEKAALKTLAEIRKKNPRWNAQRWQHSKLNIPRYTESIRYAFKKIFALPSNQNVLTASHCG